MMLTTPESLRTAPQERRLRTGHTKVSSEHASAAAQRIPTTSHGVCSQEVCGIDPAAVSHALAMLHLPDPGVDRRHPVAGKGSEE